MRDKRSLDSIIISDTGYASLEDFTLDGKPCRIVGTKSGGYKASEAIDEIRFQDGTRAEYTRGELWMMQKEGRII